MKAKQKLEKNLKEVWQELKWYQEKLDFEIDYQRKLEDLQKAGVIDSNYDPV